MPNSSDLQKWGISDRVRVVSTIPHIRGEQFLNQVSYSNTNTQFGTVAAGYLYLLQAYSISFKVAALGAAYGFCDIRDSGGNTIYRMAMFWNYAYPGAPFGQEFAEPIEMPAGWYFLGGSSSADITTYISTFGKLVTTAEL